MATTAPGLEQAAISEVLAKVAGAQMEESLRGRVLFRVHCSLQDLLRLRSADNLYYHIARFPVGRTRADLPKVSQAIASLNLDAALSFLTDTDYRHSRVFVNASRWGHHTYSRFDAAEAALAGLMRKHRFKSGTAQLHDLEFRLDILGVDALFSLKLTPSTFRFRGSNRAFSRAALRPTVAHALVWLSEPNAEDVFLDPFCGSGTIVAERCLYDAAAIVASDVSPNAIAIAEANVPDYVCVERWDARDIKMARNSVSVIVTNLPWGKQIEAENGLLPLYLEFLREARRVLHPEGRAIVLTDQTDSLLSAAQRNGFTCKAIATISLHGLLPTAYLMGLRE